jgi:hypothetical protein
MRARTGEGMRMEILKQGRAAAGTEEMQAVGVAVIGCLSN